MQEKTLTFVRDTLTYLSDDWTWSEILLEMLDTGNCDHQMIQDIADYLSDAILRCQDSAKRRELIHIHERITQIRYQELTEHGCEMHEVRSLLDTL